MGGDPFTAMHALTLGDVNVTRRLVDPTYLAGSVVWYTDCPRPQTQAFWPQDAIESLSPEQRAFAKAFRAMQLESTLFGILVPCLRPQGRHEVEKSSRAHAPVRVS